MIMPKVRAAFHETTPFRLIRPDELEVKGTAIISLKIIDAGESFAAQRRAQSKPFRKLKQLGTGIADDFIKPRHLCGERNEGRSCEQRNVRGGMVAANRMKGIHRQNHVAQRTELDDENAFGSVHLCRLTHWDEGVLVSSW